MTTISKNEAKEIANKVFERYPKTEKVIVASDGQAFISDLNDMAAKNHSRNNSYKKELELFTFLRESEAGTKSAKVEYAKTVKEVAKDIEAAETVEAVQAILDAENATGAPRAGVVKEVEKKLNTLNGK